MPFILTSPASSGISLALARELLKRTELPIFATARSNLDAIKAKILDGHEDHESRITMLEVDYLKEETLADAAKKIRARIGEDYLRLTTITPGILLNPEKSPSQIDYHDALETFKLNTLGPMLAIKHFSPFLPTKNTKLDGIAGLPDHAVWATMSARVGSIGDNRLGGWYAYRASKAAVNQLSRTFSNHLRMSKSPSISITLHPGTVKTNLSKDFWSSTKPEMLFSPEYSASALLDVIRNLKMGDNGRQFDYKGDEIVP